MKQITREVLRIYKPISGLDWMNYKIVRSDMTAHHVIKKEHGGQMKIGNICPLRSVSHQYLHLIECKDIDTYVAINEIFKIVCNQMSEPTREQRELIEYLLLEFERVHRWDKGSKGKLLLQKKYLDREDISVL